MKTKLFFAALLIGAISLPVMSQTPVETKAKVDIQLSPNNQIRIWYLDAQNEKVNVKIYDQQGELVDTRRFQCTGNMKIYYDLSQLTDGDYLISVCNKKTPVCTEKVTIANGKLACMPIPVDVNMLNLADNK
jgi:hypothetical protein